MKLKKYRKKAASFLVEGAKNVLELIESDYEIQNLFVTNRFLDSYMSQIPVDFNYVICSEKELEGLGTFNTNEYALAVARVKSSEFDISKDEMILALDDVSDPGNLGTIIRIADWYGIKTILASQDTADFYNPKVINASMGSFTRVDVHYMDLFSFFESNDSHQIYGAMLDGSNVHHEKFEKPFILLMGNESKGINDVLARFVDKKITIPRIGGAESLNVAVSTAIICDNICRN